MDNVYKRTMLWMIKLGYHGDSLGLPWILLFLSILITQVTGNCPRDVSMEADECFADYGTHLQNMRMSSLKLCCGVDVELLRAFCSSYLSARSCIDSLSDRCPLNEAQISESLIHFEGSEDGLEELCSDDKLYERYAIHQACFAKQKDYSERCIKRYLNNSILVMSSIDSKSIDELCSNIKKILDCIKPNIVRKCGLKAAKLVEVLVKPMIKGSTQCDYNIVKAKTTKTPGESTLRNRHVITVHSNGATSVVTSQRLGLRAVCIFIIVILVSFR